MTGRLMPTVCIGAAFLTLMVVAGRLLPSPDGTFGTDWGYFLSYLLVGEQWIRFNGWLTPAYFTPAFCGVIPYLANPQSVIWSLPQVFFLMAGPEAVPRVTLFASAIAGGWGCYLLVRQCFGISREFSALACVLFILNGFLTFRLVAGHLTYWTFAFVPWLAWLVLDRAGHSGSWASSLRRVVCCGLLVALTVYGGALNFIVPMVLSVSVVILLRQLSTGLQLPHWRRLAGGCLWSIPLAAIKLAPAAVLSLHFPREYLARSLFTQPGLFMSALFNGFFLPQRLLPLNPLGNGQYGLFSHELEFGVSIIPLFAFSMATVRWFSIRRGPTQPVAVLLMLALLAVPIAGSVGNHSWGLLLQSIPVINNNTMLIRWWIVYVLFLIVATALVFDSLVIEQRARTIFLTACTAIVIVQFASRDLTIYQSASPLPGFDAELINRQHASLASGTDLEPVTRLGTWPPDPKTRSLLFAPVSLIGGTSSLPCYEPLFGYQNELFPAQELTEGSVLPDFSDSANLADPRCYLGSTTVSCRPGDRFKSTDSAVTDFVLYRPIAWNKPWWQVLGEWSTFASVVASAFLIVLAGYRAKRDSTRPIPSP